MKQLRFIRLFAIILVYPMIGIAQLGWTLIPSPTSNHLYSVSFADSLVGTAVGANGTIIRTTDGGLHWFLQSSGFQKTLHDVKMTDALTAITVGDSATILRSTDGGTNWQHIQSVNSNDDLYSIKMIHKDTGWIGGNHNAIQHTTDGWTSWTIQFTDQLGSVGELSCANSNVCMATAGGVLNKTTNGGQTWTRIGYAPGVGNIQFIDADTAIGSGAFIHSGTLVRTTDGGYNWDVKYYTGNGNYIYDVGLSDSRAGVAVGESGTIAQTTDDGVSWISQQSGTDKPLYGCAAIGNLFIAVGLEGTILRAKDTVVVSVDQGKESKTPKDFKLRENFPNPFNFSTRIQYEIPRKERVFLTIYNILGQQITTLVDEVKEPGVYNVEWNGATASSGVYVYRLSSISSIHVRKMILIK